MNYSTRTLNSRRAFTRHLPAFLAGLALPLAGSAWAAPALLSTLRTPAAADRVLTSTMAHKPQSGWTGVILKVAAPLTPAQEAQVHSLGGDLYCHLPVIGSVAVRVPSRNLQKLASLPFVTHLSFDGTVKKCDEFTVGSSEAGIAFQKYGLTGSGVTVAVIDSGIRADEDLANPQNRVLTTTSCVPADSNPDDLCGHGTHVAGIIAGNGAASTGSGFTHTYYGIARDANIVSVRVLDKNGQGSVSTAIAGIQWVITHRNDNQSAPIRVINLSLGHPVCDSYAQDPLCQVVESAWKSGIVVVCAAGNNGRLNTTNTVGLNNEGWGTAYGSINSPGNDPYVITVGAMKNMDGIRADDKIATYSGRGPSVLDLVLKPDIVAPGNHVVSLASYGSTLYQWNNTSPSALLMSTYETWGWNGPSTDYFILSGTSMATPVVAGAAALLLQKYPTLTPDTVKARLMVSADKMLLPDGTADPLTYGAGYLNIPAALACTLTTTQPALSPTLYLDAAGNLAVEMNPKVFGSHAVWGTHAIWGSTTLTNLQTIWGSHAVWGSASDTTASHAVWGSTGIAEQHAVWGSSNVWGSNVGASHAVWGSSGSVDLSNIVLKGE